MKKPVMHSVCSLFLACSMIFPYTNYIHAQEESELTEEQSFTIQSAEDFITYFCNVEILADGIEEELQETPQYAPIQEITPDNYFIVLAGNEVYNTLDETMQQQINEILESDKETYPLSWQEMVDAALLLNEEMNPEEGALLPEETEQPKTPADTTQENPPVTEDFVLPQNPVTEILDSAALKPEQAPVQEESPSNESNATEPLETPKEETDTNAGNENETAENSEAANSAAVNQAEPAKTQNEPEPASSSSQDVQTLSLLEVGKEENLQPEAAVIETTPAVQEEIQNTLAPVPEEKAEEKVEAESENTINNALNEQARNFIVQYLSAGTDNVFYTNANAANYRSILNSLKVWNGMDTSLRLAINQQLIDLIGKPYQALLLEAQSFSLNNMSNNRLPNNAVITSANMNAQMYTSAALLSLIAAVALIKFRK